jgi:hypothetical protein
MRYTVEKMEGLKARIHAMRFPIKSVWGRRAMGVVYFTVPIIAGWYVMEATNSMARANLGEGRAKLLAAKASWTAAPTRAAPPSASGA